MNKVILLVPSVICALSAHADVINFPRVYGNDIADPVSWGGTLPGTTDTIAFTGTTQTVTASADAEFGRLINDMIKSKSHTLTFDMRGVSPVPTLKFDGYQVGSAHSRDKLFSVFRGGIYDFKGNSFAMGSTYYANGRLYQFTDGAFVTNVNNIYLGYTAQNELRMELSGGSKVFVNGIFKITNNKTAKGNDNWLKVTGGSLLRVAGQFLPEDTVATWDASLRQQPDGGLFHKDPIEVSGEGSEIWLGSLGNGKYQYPCGQQGGSVLLVTSNATMKVNQNAILWGKFTRNSLIRVSDGGQLSFSSSVYGGWDSVVGGERLNRIEILSGGTLSVGGSLYVGYSSSGAGGNPGNTLLVSNGTLRCNGFCAGYIEGNGGAVAEASSNQLVVIQGPQAEFSPGSSFGMFTAPFCEYRVELGAKFNPKPCSSFGRFLAGRHDDTVRVRRGGIFEFHEFRTTYENVSSEVIGWNNRIVAEEGGVVTGNCMVVQGRNCALRVDDSTVVLTNSTAAGGALYIGYTGAKPTGGIGTNCVLEVAGTRPSIKLSGNLKVYNDSRICFELPADGYEADAMPIEAEGAFTMDESSRLAFEGAEEMFAAHETAERRADYVLAENPAEKGFLSNDAVAAAQTELGDGFKLFKRVRNGRNQLVLRVKGVDVGTLIIVK